MNLSEVLMLVVLSRARNLAGRMEPCTGRVETRWCSLIHCVSLDLNLDFVSEGNSHLTPRNSLEGRWFLYHLCDWGTGLEAELGIVDF